MQEQKKAIDKVVDNLVDPLKRSPGRRRRRNTGTANKYQPQVSLTVSILKVVELQSQPKCIKYVVVRGRSFI